MSLQVVYAREEMGGIGSPSIFLAGPTPREQETPSWRPEALAVLDRAGYAGSVLVPEDRGGVFRGDYTDQVEWEWEALERADVLVFWVPRRFPEMPALTTNVEFGLWARSGKVVLGAPPEAQKVRYLLWVASELGIPTFQTLEDTLGHAVERVG